MTFGVYKLQPILDDPRFDGFGWGRVPSLRGNAYLGADFMPDAKSGGEIPRLAKVWAPVKVQGRVRPFNDFPGVGSEPAFSQRAVDALRVFLEPNGELLPLVSDLGSYYAYNTTTLVDVLDVERSKVERYKSGKIMSIDRFEIFPEELTGLSIFRFRERPVGTYVTTIFVDRAREAGLVGFDFIKVWPLPPGRNEQSYKLGLPKGKPKSTAKATVKKPVKVKPIDGNSVIIRLTLKAQKPTRAEKDAVEKLLDQLDTLLVQPEKELSAPAVGSLEGHEYANGQCALSLSCPDADALVDAIRPWLKSIDWPAGFTVVKRDAEYYNVEARETTVAI